MIATALFLLSAAFVLYVLAGYPLLVAALARRRGRPVRKNLEYRTVTILLPVRNGEPWIRDKLRSILSLDYPRDLVQAVVISDGSSDRTEDIVREFASEGIELLAVPAGGKALALNAGLARARGEILFFTDVRQALAPDSLKNLMACFGDPEVGVASGELIIRAGETQAEAHTGLYWRYEKWIRKSLSRIDSVLGATGCIYAMRASLAAPLTPGTILDDVNLPLGAFFRGYRIVLDETARAYDFPTSLKTEFRRKVRTQAGVYQTIGAFPALLGPSNRMWIHFVSHKLGRLLLPWALVTAAISSFFLPPGWREAAIAAQTAVYAFALADTLTPERFPLKRLTSPVRTFVVLMAAALCGVSIFFVPQKALWKETRAGARAARSS